MGIIEHAQLLEQIHNLIKSKSTGTPSSFASHLNISERTLYRIIEELRDRGADIAFNTARMTYYYRNDVEIKLQVRIGDSGSKVKGGQASMFFEKAFNYDCFFLPFND